MILQKVNKKDCEVSMDLAIQRQSRHLRCFFSTWHREGGAMILARSFVSFMSSQTPPFRVLIIRLTALGDVVQAHEALRSVLPLLPNCHWTWAVAGPYTALIEGEVGVDELIDVPKRWTLTSWLDFRKQQQGVSFDLIIDAQCLLKSWLVRAVFSAPETISWGSNQSRDWLAPKLYGHRLNDAPVSSRDAFLALVAKGLSLIDVSIGQPLISKKTLSPLGKDFRVVCAIGAGWPTKQLSMANWVRLLDAIREDCPDQELFFLTGTDAERKELEGIWPECEKRGARLLPNMNLKELKGFLGPNDLFIGMDSGPTHLASSRGSHTLTFFGASLPEAYDPSGAGAHAPRGICHLGEVFERRCDQLRHCQRCSAIDSIDVVAAWRTYWASLSFEVVS